MDDIRLLDEKLFFSAVHRPRVVLRMIPPHQPAFL